jgi:hypothetical protein|tara:strand:+ start:29937 stop:30206 length:270 start_codon:yes stop_codon:yes gene_type:complete
MTVDNNLTVEKWCKDNDYEYWSEGWNESDMLEFAEAYHKAKVESITDDIIHEKSFELEEHIEHRTGYRKGAQWLKSQLLKANILLNEAN